MIYLTGDTHCPFDVEKLEIDSFPEQEQMTKQDYLIILGDAGIIWSDYRNRDEQWIRYFTEKNFTTLFIDGNHENHTKLNAYPVSVWNGGKVHQISDSVYHLMRGQIFHFCGLSFFTMGGAKSIFSDIAIEGRGWWQAEMPNQAEYEEAFMNLMKSGWKVDYVFTHAAPSSLAEQISTNYKPNRLYEFLERIDKQLQYQHWYFGHYHIDKAVDEKHTCLFSSFLRLL